MTRGLSLRRRSATKYTVYRNGEDVAELVQEMSPAGPKWFAKVRPLGALCAPGECATLREAVEALYRASDDGDF